MLIHWDEVCDIFCPKNNIFLTYSSDCLRPTPTRLAQTTKMDILFCFEIHIQCLIGPNPMDPNAFSTWSYLLTCTYPFTEFLNSRQIRSLNKKPMLTQLFNLSKSSSTPNYEQQRIQQGYLHHTSSFNKNKVSKNKI